MSDKIKMAALSTSVGTDADQPTQKKSDTQNHWRNKTISFRVSPEENELFNIAASLSGLTMQEYITMQLINRSVVISGDHRIYKVLLDHMEKIYWQLRRIEAGNMVDDELLTAIYMISQIMDGMREPGNHEC